MTAAADHVRGFDLKVRDELEPRAHPIHDGRIPTELRAFPKDKAALEALSAAAAQHDAMVLAGNGAIALGDDLTQALLRMELVEHYAKILHLAQSLGPVRALEEGQVKQLLEA